MRSQSAPSALSVPSPANICTRKEPILLDELYWIRRRPTLPGRFQPSTISVLRLNFCVRDGNRWIPQAIVTGNSQCEYLLLPPFWYRRFGYLPPDFLAPSRLQLFSAPSKPHRLELRFRLTMTSTSSARNFFLLLSFTNHWLRFQFQQSLFRSACTLTFRFAPRFPTPYCLLPNPFS